VKYLLKMLKQPSTYAGIAMAAQAGAQAAQGQGTRVGVLTGIMGLLAIFIDGNPQPS